MSNLMCPQCGAPIDPGTLECKFCGEKIAAAQTVVNQPAASNPVFQEPPIVQTIYVQQTAINPAWPLKSKVAAGLLGIFFGCFGIHKFYMGRIGMGILYLIFCWTGIPAFVGFIEGIIYLCSNNENFQIKHHVRLQ